MGADLLLAVVELRETKEQTLARLDARVFTEDDLAIFEDAGCFLFYDEDWSEELIEKMRDALRDSINAVYGPLNRDSLSIHIDGDRAFVITGGTSWGDEPSIDWDDYNLFNAFLGFPYWLSPDDPKRQEWEQ